MNFLNRLKIYLPFLIIGSCIGWLMSLSDSPVISIVFTSVLFSLSALLTVFTEPIKGENDISENEKKSQTTLKWLKGKDAWPLVCLLVGIAVMGTCGLWIRNNDPLHKNDLDAKINKWTSLMNYQNNYDYQRIEIKKLSTDAKNLNKIDSINNFILKDSCENLKLNRLIRFYIVKALFEEKNNTTLGIDLESKENLKILIKLKKTKKEDKKSPDNHKSIDYFQSGEEEYEPR